MKLRLRNLIAFAPVVGAILIIVILLLIVGTNPIEAFSAIITGAFGSVDKFLNTSAFWVPLLLASTGLLVTFSAGLWNIGIEGQIIMGALAASAVALNLEAPQAVMITLEILAAMAAVRSDPLHDPDMGSEAVHISVPAGSRKSRVRCSGIIAVDRFSGVGFFRDCSAWSPRQSTGENIQVRCCSAGS